LFEVDDQRHQAQNYTQNSVRLSLKGATIHK
jgi:hypothetical protein